MLVRGIIADVEVDFIVSDGELDALRTAMTEREGLIASIFSLLRNAPRYIFTVQLGSLVVRADDRSSPGALS